MTLEYDNIFEAITNNKAEATKLKNQSDSMIAKRDINTKQSTNKYKLDDLLAKCDENATLDAELKEWLEAPLVGKEIV